MQQNCQPVAWRQYRTLTGAIRHPTQGAEPKASKATVQKSNFPQGCFAGACPHGGANRVLACFSFSIYSTPHKNRDAVGFCVSAPARPSWTAKTSPPCL